MGWFSKRPEASEFEARLRSERPSARPEFVSAVADRIHARRSRQSLRLRVVLAATLTLAMFVAVASVGGVSYAAGGAKKAVESVANIASATVVTSHKASSAEDEYEKACKDAVKQKKKAEKEFHKANKEEIKAIEDKDERKAAEEAEKERHKAVMKELKEEKKACKEKDEEEDD